MTYRSTIKWAALGIWYTVRWYTLDAAYTVLNVVSFAYHRIMHRIRGTHTCDCCTVNAASFVDDTGLTGWLCTECVDYYGVHDDNARRDY